MLTDQLAGFVNATIGVITYREATLHRSTTNDNGKGTITRELDPFPVRVQVDSFSQGQRPEGYAEDDVRLLILSAGVRALPNGRLQDDDLVTVAGQTFAIAGPTRDPLDTHWTARGRPKATPA